MENYNESDSLIFFKRITNKPQVTITAMYLGQRMSIYFSGLQHTQNVVEPVISASMYL